MKLVSIVGTNSDRSTNRKLLQFIATHFAKKAEIEILEIKHLPAFNEPEDETAPAAIEELSQKIKNADGVIISTPEYDHSIPASLKSVFEWLSYSEQPFIDKPVMIVGASLGSLGSSRAQGQLRQILDSPELKARVLPSAEFLLGRSGEAFNTEGQLVYPEKVAELEDIFNEFLLFVEITNRLIEEQKTRQPKKEHFSWKDIIR
ncbi:MAG: NAD(P)H-dependent oxidoreductase [Tetragenococcus halophilus]|uniref:NADPH-dependent FMN reductase n=1 Tax=Tetragenococcus halophilus TaxID=51669 RepID=UPI001F37A4A9|nr:NADPH-dependent FMN reductase [Tetragenococcus halophilus]MDN6195142.1 NAD(P)H-dependent oxidoreductase [Atopostipes suicloacalis]MDN6268073.1 NAD(P)H-dependent oxidoreductase [Tetragenococcus koreensis]MDN6641106.1 NAD(P)H-dependent oxidoreductase [Tetragenococcus sp.]MCF1676622.1 NAD(P)H-dependent oxidoreductase [Tetragenococcus halophilus]MDN6153840.1 NAD(P)H-dependent oxidoreductase [Tetragenococcus halophilus]